jgi:hypothetical protein
MRRWVMIVAFNKRLNNPVIKHHHPFYHPVRSDTGFNPPPRGTRGRCYDHNFLRFSQIFREKNVFFFLKNQCYDNFCTISLCCFFVKKRLFSQIFWSSGST